MLHMMHLLVKHGADLNCSLVPSKETVLHVAVRHGLLNAVRMLVPLVPDPTAAAEEGNTAAHLAARYGRIDILQVLLQQFGDILVNAANASGETPLHIAARYDQAEAIKALVATGAIVDARRDFDQSTPLCVACLFNSSEAAVLLLRHGASLAPRGIVAPRSQALAWGNHGLAARLEEMERAGPDGFRSWVREPRLALLKLRLLSASNRAEITETTTEEARRFSASFSSASSTSLSVQFLSSPSHGNERLSNRDIQAQRAIQFVFGTGSQRELFAPDNVFNAIVSFWWP